MGPFKALWNALRNLAEAANELASSFRDLRQEIQDRRLPEPEQVETNGTRRRIPALK